MAKPLSKEQINVNADLAAIGGKAFTELEYRTNEDAITLLAMKNGTFISELTDPIDRISEYQRLLHAVAKLRPTDTIKSLAKFIIDAAHPSSATDRQQAINKINTLAPELGLQVGAVIEIIKECKTQPLPISEAFETHLIEKLENAKDINAMFIKKTTARVLGLDHKPLINQIADDAYLLAGMTHTCPECGHTVDADDIQVKIDTWVLYCHIIDKSIVAMKREFPTWDKMPTKQKNKHIESWKLLTKVANIHELNLLLHFVENYGMNQGVLAKAKALLAQQLPNINTLEIAKAITIHSSLNK
jgi:hypothetical protein